MEDTTRVYEKIEFLKDVTVGIRFELHKKLLLDLSENFRLTTYIDSMREAMIIQLSASLYSYKFAEKSESIVFPRDWWEAFKERFFPTWMLRRWPVKRTIVTCSFSAHEIVRPILPEKYKTGLCIVHMDKRIT